MADNDQEKYKENIVQVTSQSLNQAHRHLDDILQEICQKKWEDEVVAKKGKPSSVAWVFSQAADCQVMKHDPNKVTTQFDNDFDDEPNAGRADWYQSDKARVKIKFRTLKQPEPVGRKMSSQSVTKRKAFRKSVTGISQGQQLFQAQRKLSSQASHRKGGGKHHGQRMENINLEFGGNNNNILALHEQTSKSTERSDVFDTKNKDSSSPKIVSMYLGEAPLDNPKESNSAMFRKRGLRKNSGTDLLLLRQDSEQSNQTSLSAAKKKRLVVNRQATTSGLNNKRPNQLLDQQSNASGSSIRKSMRKTNNLYGKKESLPKEREGPRPIPIPKTEKEIEQIAEDEAFFAKTKDFRAQLRVRDMIKERKESLLIKRVGVKDHDPFYQIEQSTEYMKPLNIEKLQGILLQEVKAKVHRNVQRIPMKQSNGKDMKSAYQSHQPEQSQQTSLMGGQLSININNASINSKIQSSRGVVDESNDIIIDENTHLLDVLADEMEYNGYKEGSNVNGLQSISGLNFKSEHNQSSRTGRKNDDFRGTLSSVNSIPIQPGVKLKEFKEDKKHPKKEPEFIKVSGGRFIATTRNQQSGLDSQRMSLDDYGKMQGSRTYLHVMQRKSTQYKDSSEVSTGQATPMKKSNSHIRVLGMNVTEEAEEFSQSTVGKPNQSRLFPRRTLNAFAQNKNYRGKVIVNNMMTTSSNEKKASQTLRNSLQQKTYVQNLMMEHADVSNEYEVTIESSPRSKGAFRTFAPNTMMNASINTNLCASVNPIEHNYARELDIRLNASNKSRGSLGDNQSIIDDLDSINRQAGKSLLKSVGIKKNLSRADTQSRHPYYDSGARLFSGQASSSVTRAQTSEKRSRAERDDRRDIQSGSQAIRIGNDSLDSRNNVPISGSLTGSNWLSNAKKVSNQRYASALSRGYGQNKTKAVDRRYSNKVTVYQTATQSLIKAQH